jgi:hypothetical protein
MTDPRELLDALFDRPDQNEWSDADASAKLAVAIRAVLDLHTPTAPPEGHSWVSGGKTPHCEGCASGDPYLDPDWPCPTVLAITAAFEGEAS